MKLPFNIGEEPAEEPIESERLLSEDHYRDGESHPLVRRRSQDELRDAIYKRAGYGAWAADSFSRLGAVGAVRQIVATAPLAQAYIGIMRREVVGHTTPAPTFSNVDRQRDREKLVELWAKWALDPSVNGNADLPALLRALVASMVMDGRVFALMQRNDEFTCGLGLLPVTRDWLVENTTGTEEVYNAGGASYKGIGGVIRSEAGRITHYVFYGKPDPVQIIKHKNSSPNGYGQLLPVSKAGRYIVPADQVLDLYSTKNASEFDGSPSHLLPALDKIKELAALDTAVVGGMNIAAYKMGFLKKQLGAPTLTAQKAKDANNFVRPPTKFQKHRLAVLPEGWDVETFEPSQPNPAMSEYRKELIMNAAAALGVDNATLAGDLRQVNFSSSRAGILAARDTYRVMQREIERRVLRPALARLIETAMLRGEINISSKSARLAAMSDFRHRGWSWVDPRADIKAALLAMQMGVDSPQRIAAQNGIDYDQIINDLAEAKAKMEAAGLVFPQALQADSDEPPMADGNENASGDENPVKENGD